MLSSYTCKDDKSHVLTLQVSPLEISILVWTMQTVYASKFDDPQPVRFLQSMDEVQSYYCVQEQIQGV